MELLIEKTGKGNYRGVVFEQDVTGCRTVKDVMESAELTWIFDAASLEWTPEDKVIWRLERYDVPEAFLGDYDKFIAGEKRAERAVLMLERQQLLARLAQINIYLAE